MDDTAHAERRLAQIEQDPRYRALVAARSRLGWLLSLAVIAVFFGFMLLVAFGKSFLAQPLGDLTTTIGIPIGLGVILFGIAVTGIYVAIANSRFDKAAAGLLADYAE